MNHTYIAAYSANMYTQPSIDRRLLRCRKVTYSKLLCFRAISKCFNKFCCYCILSCIFQQPASIWLGGEEPDEVQQKQAESCISEGQGMTCWREALQRRTWVFWWTTGLFSLEKTKRGSDQCSSISKVWEAIGWGQTLSSSVQRQHKEQQPKTGTLEVPHRFADMNFFKWKVTEHWNRLFSEVVEIFKTHLDTYLCNLL